MLCSSLLYLLSFSLSWFMLHIVVFFHVPFS
jgi:hypothetical protein